MTTNKDTNQDTAPAGRKPSHRLYIVTGEGEKAVWRPIGAGWSHGDGKGFNLSCDAVPLQGRIVMRVITPKTDATDGQGGLV